MNMKKIITDLRYFLFEKEFSGPGLGVLGLMLIPLIAYPQTLTDYENTATVTASPDQFETNTANNSDTVAVIPNAEIVIVKEVINDDGGLLTVADFNITTNASAIAGALTFDGGSTSGDTTTYTSNTLHVPPGDYSLIEGDVVGYTPGTWECDVGTLNNDVHSAGSLSLTAGQVAECTIVNDDVQPQLTLTKLVTNDDGGGKDENDFGLTVAHGTVSDPATSGLPVSVPANTTITISELVDPGYTAGAWECTDAGGAPVTLTNVGAATDTLQLLPGDEVECEIANDDIGPMLTLSKTVENGLGGTNGPDDFGMQIAEGTEPVVSATSDTAYPVDANALIIISEQAQVDYSEGTWACVDASGIMTAAELPSAGDFDNTEVTLAPGANVTCSITNTNLGIDLVIAKAVSDATPDIGDTITFTLTVTNDGPDTATNATVTDIVPAGFSYAGNITGGTSFDDTDPAGAGLSWALASVPVGTPIVLTFDVTVNAP